MQLNYNSYMYKQKKKTGFCLEHVYTTAYAAVPHKQKHKKNDLY